MRARGEVAEAVQDRRIVAVAVEAAPLRRAGAPRTYLSMALRRFRQDRLAMAGLVLLLLVSLLALGADLIASQILHKTPYEQHPSSQFAGIGEDGYWLGADEFGRDTATRLLHGARVSLGVAGLSLLVAGLIGVSVGAMAGYRGGVVDGALMRFVDAMLAIPALFLLLLVASLWQLGPELLAFVIAAVSWLYLARLVRGEVLAIRGLDYVTAARVVGAGDRHILVRHILPNVVPVIIVWASLTLPFLILYEAALSYLGLGVQPPTASWGNMLSGAQRVWTQSAAMVLLPGLAMYLTVFAINLVGNGLRDALDPRLQA